MRLFNQGLKPRVTAGTTQLPYSIAKEWVARGDCGTTLDDINLQRTTFAQAMAAGQARIDSDAAASGQPMAMLDTFKPLFEIVRPLGIGAPGAR